MPLIGIFYGVNIHKPLNSLLVERGLCFIIYEIIEGNIKNICNFFLLLLLKVQLRYVHIYR